MWFVFVCNFASTIAKEIELCKSLMSELFYESVINNETFIVIMKVVDRYGYGN